jgi:hypothetical protein
MKTIKEPGGRERKALMEAATTMDRVASASQPPLRRCERSGQVSEWKLNLDSICEPRNTIIIDMISRKIRKLRLSWRN